MPGCSKELDELADKFLKNPSQRKQILLEAEEILEKIECEEVNKLTRRSINTTFLTNNSYNLFVEEEVAEDVHSFDEGSD